ncbi:MAG TPA: AraC family transcriptional regulator [Clostridiales bacterium]|nr:AraC family transcriptional regulator [Clostridiales bacterium]
MLTVYFFEGLGLFMEGRFNLKSINIYYCGKEKCQSGHFYGPAIRPHYLVHFILNGKGQYHARGRIYHLKRGDAFLICPNESTYYIADEKCPWEYAWVAVGGSEVDPLLEMCNMHKNNLVYIAESRFMDGIGEEERNHRILELVDLFNENHYNEAALLGSFYNIFSYMIKKEAAENFIPREVFYKEACSYIQHNYSYDIRINDVANFIGIDRTYLYKIFMEKEKISPQQYLIQYRLHVAVNMLYDTKLTITEIALSCGFKELSSFSRLFMKHMGVSPRQFRKNMIHFQ